VNFLDTLLSGAYHNRTVATGVGAFEKWVAKEGSLRGSRWIMRRNVVALADKEYDALAAPLVDEACRIIRQIGGSRAHLLPVIIGSLWPYAREYQVSQSSETDPLKVRNPHCPHLRIHTSDSGQD
jgi:hypothetical protein